MPRELLNADELEIMTALWERGPLKPAEIQEQLSSAMKNSALRWQLGELIKRGWLSRDLQGKAFVYSASKPRRSVFGLLTRRLKELLFGGSALAMVGEMIEAGELTPEELRQLAEIAGARAEPGGKPASTKSAKPKKQRKK